MAQSTICADTGNGTTVACSAGITRTIRARSITPGRFQIDALDCSDLSTTGMRKTVASDLFDAPELEVEEIFDSFYAWPALGISLGTVTVTLPLRTGELTPATYAGTAYLMGITPPRFVNGELQVWTLTIKWDGATGPVFTKST